MFKFEMRGLNILRSTINYLINFKNDSHGKGRFLFRSWFSPKFLPKSSSIFDETQRQTSQQQEIRNSKKKQENGDANYVLHHGAWCGASDAAISKTAYGYGLKDLQRENDHSDDLLKLGTSGIVLRSFSSGNLDFWPKQRCVRSALTFVAVKSIPSATPLCNFNPGSELACCMLRVA